MVKKPCKAGVPAGSGHAQGCLSELVKYRSNGQDTGQMVKYWSSGPILANVGGVACSWHILSCLSWSGEMRAYANTWRARARGRILVQYWSNTGQILVKYWSNTGKKLVEYWSKLVKY